ncbi:CD63 antigen-like [Euwallacea fornicatus]|uniref:CD63 antigen-like n=1 Tax=Euwallacea fornicatus TaxID=995702 RepID=UPI00338E8ECC
MNLSCNCKMIKYLMFGFNLLFVITGIIIIAVGTAVKTVYTEYEAFLDNKYFSLPNMLIATGVIIFIISFLGCCGAAKENWIMLAIFSVLLCIIFIFEFASGIAGYVLRDRTEAYLEETLRANLASYNKTHYIWDLIQESFQCCGVDDYNDWIDIFNNSSKLPISCCPRSSGIVGAFYCNANFTTSVPTSSEVTSSTVSTTVPSNTSTNGTNLNVMNRRKRDIITTELPPSSTTPYSEGCKQAFGDYLRKHAVQIGGCAFGLAVLQILGIIFSCHLVRQLKNGYCST